MGYCNCKKFLLLAIFYLLFVKINSASLSDGNGTHPSDLNGKKLMEIGKKLNLPKLEMIGKAIENGENEIQGKICDLHPCSDWTEWLGCTARIGQFGSKFRTRRCSINMTNCEIDSTGRTEKEFGICVGYCPDGYNITKNGFCMKLYADKKLKTGDAEQQCQKDGGHLVNIDSEIKFQDVNSVVTGFLRIAIRIDGRRKNVNSPWKYTYGSQKGFDSKWYSGYPTTTSTERCLVIALYNDGLQWHDSPCDTGYDYICEIVKTM